MRQWIRSHLTYANVVSTLCLFLLLGGGTAVALNGSNTVQSDDLGPGAQVKAPDVAANAVNSADVANNSLTGADIADRSGVDTCEKPLTAKFGPICAGSDGAARANSAAVNYCAGLRLRLPTFSEAVALAKKYDVPGVSGSQVFWSDDTAFLQNSLVVSVVDEDGSSAVTPASTPEQAVCVTDPSA